MVIAVPVAQSELTVTDFGKPVADGVNALQPGVWNAITTFQNGWQNYDGAAPAGRYLKWRREANGVIRWTGVLRIPGASLSTTSTICDIPAAAYSSGAPSIVVPAQNHSCMIEISNSVRLNCQPFAGETLTLYVFVDMSYAVA